MRRYLTALVGALAPLLGAVAQQSQPMTAEEFLASLDFQTGEVVLPGGIATITLPGDFRYLSPQDTEKVLTIAWGNPPGSETLGMLVPNEESILRDDGWAAVISYEEDGYVSDEDADSIDYAELLEAMKAASEEQNQARVEAGYEPVDLVGWAAEPRYDKSAHKLYWAKELKFGDIPVNTLNYNVRILGRKGVLVLNLVATMPQLADIEANLPEVLAMANFNPGYRYSEFDPALDKVAAYGIGALIAGKVAAKTGLLAKLGVLLVALKKFWVIALVAVGAFFGRLFKRNKSTESTAAS